jgi:hypothetical protein
MTIPTHSRLGHDHIFKGGKVTLWDKATVPRPSIALGSTREPVVPLVSSAVPGPLELMHLPRMWLEGVLEATGRLAPPFTDGRPLFDEVLCHTIGLDRAAFHRFVRTAPLPDYLACERWVREHARKLNFASIAQVNNAILKAREDGISLVLRDDVRAWDAIYATIVSHQDTPLEPIVPAISSRTCGLLGVDHLPRLWLKNMLKTAGALPWGYRAGPHRVVRLGLAYVSKGLDAVLCTAIGLDMYASQAFIESTLPDFPAYEGWVQANAQRLDVATITRYNAICSDSRAEKVAAEKAYAGWDNPSGWYHLVDDLIDWRLIYDIVTGAPIPSWTGPRP